MKPFKDLVVVELGSVLAIPAVGMFFAELGAKVIKVENELTGGDMTRSWKLPSESKVEPTSAYFHAVNYQKKHLFLDVSKAEGKAVVMDLIKSCDVVLSNFKKSSAEKLQLDYKSLKEWNPTLIYAQLYAFDDEDNTPALDVVLQAETGFMFMTGEVGGKPVKMPVALIDLLAAHQLKEGILIALMQRNSTGKGAYVSASLYESALASLANQATNWLMAGHIPQRMGSAHPNIMPYGDVYQTQEGKELVLACATLKHWQSLCKVLGIQLDSEFDANQVRVEHRAYLWQLIQEKISGWSCEALTSELKEAQVPFGIIKNMQEVFENPTAQAMILTEYDETGKVSQRVKTVAFEIS
ncbi:MAG: CaiB/BaiF CoA-transferase family protein [Spirosomataceae bacterium]